MSDKYPIVRKKKYYWKNGKEVKDQKTLERIKKLRIPPAYKDVKIYSRNSDIQYTGVDDKGRTQTGYHERRIRERNRKKFNGLIAFVEAYPKIMKKVNKLIVNPKTKEQYVALAIALMDACRITVVLGLVVKNTLEILVLMELQHSLRNISRRIKTYH
jgi:DNA topoisomerase-1